MQCENDLYPFLCQGDCDFERVCLLGGKNDYGMKLSAASEDYALPKTLCTGI